MRNLSLLLKSGTNHSDALWIYLQYMVIFIIVAEIYFASLAVCNVITDVESMYSAAVVQVHRAVTSAQRTPAGVGGGAGRAAAAPPPPLWRPDREHAGGQAAPWRSNPEAHAQQ